MLGCPVPCPFCAAPIPPGSPPLWGRGPGKERDPQERDPAPLRALREELGLSQAITYLGECSSCLTRRFGPKPVPGHPAAPDGG